MGSSYLPPPEQNVVNVGDELSQTALDAINAASFPSGTNPFRTINDGGVISAYDNFKVYQAGEVVTEGGLIYVFNSTIGAAGYGPTTHPWAWTSMKGAQGDPGPQGANGSDGQQGIQGDRGDTGPQGPPGQSVPNYRGVWDGNYTYYPNDVVEYSGSSYVNVNQVSSGSSTPPAGNPFYWQLLARAGYDGQQGGQGPQGDVGPMGPSGQAISNWNSGSSYIKNDIVFEPNDPLDNATPYIATALNVSNWMGPPSQNTGEWQRLGAGLYVSIPGFNSVIQNYAALSGSVFTGRVQTAVRPNGLAGLNLGGISQNQGNPSSLFDGDVFLTDIDSTGAWNTRLCYVGKSFSGTQTAFQLAVTNGQSNFFSQPQAISTSTSSTGQAALRINQGGTQPALVVEDSTTPDTSSLVVNADGNVGIGVAAGHVGTQKLEVVGNAKADGFVSGTGPVFKVNSVTTHSGGANTHDIFMSVNGSTYRIPAIFVSTP